MIITSAPPTTKLDTQNQFKPELILEHEDKLIKAAQPQPQPHHQLHYTAKTTSSLLPPRLDSSGWLPARPKQPAWTKNEPNHYFSHFSESNNNLLGSNQQLSFQSSLRPKHIPPPDDMQKALGHSTSETNGDQWAPAVSASAGISADDYLLDNNPEWQSDLFPRPALPQLMKSPAWPPTKSSTTESVVVEEGTKNRKQTFGGLLPRLAAKLFSSGQKQQHSAAEILNEQNTYLMATHSMAAPQKESTILKSPKFLRVPKSGSTLVKSLFAREQLRRPQLLALKQQQQQQQPPKIAQPSHLVLINGQLYSVLNAASNELDDNDDGQAGKPNESVFDH